MGPNMAATEAEAAAVGQKKADQHLALPPSLFQS